jgi:hypothetical protein
MARFSRKKKTYRKGVQGQGAEEDIGAYEEVCKRIKEKGA